MDWQQVISSAAVTGGTIGLAIVAALLLFGARPDWRRNSRKRTLVYCLVGLSVVALLIGRAWAAGRPEQILARDLARTVRESVANYPQRLNEAQEVSRVTSEGTTITFVNRFVSLTVADIDVNAVLAYRERLRRDVCSTSDFVKRGATQVFAYYDRNDVFVTKMEFTSRDCAK